VDGANKKERVGINYGLNSFDFLNGSNSQLQEANKLRIVPFRARHNDREGIDLDTDASFGLCSSQKAECFKAGWTEIRKLSQAS
jgi:hypothetical protein